MEQFHKQLKEIKELLIHQNSLQKEMLTIKEAALFTGLKIPTLHKYSSQGLIKVYKPYGKNLFFKRSDLDQWMAQNGKKTIAELEHEVDDMIINEPKRRNHGA